MEARHRCGGAARHRVLPYARSTPRIERERHLVPVQARRVAVLGAGPGDEPCPLEEPPRVLAGIQPQVRDLLPLGEQEQPRPQQEAPHALALLGARHQPPRQLTQAGAGVGGDPTARHHRVPATCYDEVRPRRMVEELLEVRPLVRRKERRRVAVEQRETRRAVTRLK